MAWIIANHASLTTTDADSINSGHEGAGGVTSAAFYVDEGTFDADTTYDGWVRYAYISGPDENAISIYQVDDKQDPSLVASFATDDSLSKLKTGAEWLEETTTLVGLDETNDRLAVYTIEANAPYLTFEGYITDDASTHFEGILDFEVVDMGGTSQYAIITSSVDDTVAVVSLDSGSFGTEVAEMSATGTAAGLTGVSGVTVFEADGSMYVAASWGADATIVIYGLSGSGTLTEVATLSDPDLFGVDEMSVFVSEGDNGGFRAAVYAGAESAGNLVVMEFNGSSLDPIQSMGAGSTFDDIFDNADHLEVVDLQDSSILMVGSTDEARVYAFDIETNPLSPLFGTLTPQESGPYTRFPSDMHLLVNPEGTQEVVFVTSPTGDRLNTIQIGTEGETLMGTTDSDTIIGYEGDDIVFAGGGSDWIHVGDGENIVYGQDGEDDIYTGTGADVVRGQADDDEIYASIGEDEYRGGSGEDSISYEYLNEAYSASGSLIRAVSASSDVSVNLNLAKGTATLSNGDEQVVRSFDHADGSDQGDTIVGDKGDNFLDGREGDDLIKGGKGADGISGSEGDDTIEGGGGSDELYGDDGDDTIDGGKGDDLISGGSGKNTVEGGAGTDVFRFEFDDHGSTKILDFAVDEDILMLGMFDELSQLKAASKNTSKGLKITWEYDDDGVDYTGKIILKGISKSDLGDMEIDYTGSLSM